MKNTILKKIPLLFSPPKKIPASFIDRKKSLLAEMSDPKKSFGPPPSLKYVSGAPGVDNQGAINLAKNPVNHQRSKHIDIKYHFIRSEIQNGNVKLQYVRTDNNVADIFTKPATRVKLEKFKNFIFGS